MKDVSARTYNFDYNSCFGFECTADADQTSDDCSIALRDTTLSRDEKEAACVDLYSRFSLQIEIDRDQSIILPLLLFFGPIFLVYKAGKIDFERVQRNQTGIGSAAVFVTGLFGYVTQIGPLSFPSIYPVFAILYLVMFVIYLNVTAKHLVKK